MRQDRVCQTAPCGTHPSHPHFIMNDLTYKIFEQIEERGLQFCLPDSWRPLYREYLKEKKINKLIERLDKLAMERRDEHSE